MKRMYLTGKLVFVWVCMAAMMVEEAWCLGKGSVTITNQLQQMVRVRCYSGEDDLGRHRLDPNQVYQFVFTPHLWGNTRFFCDFDADAYGKGHIKAWEGWLWMQRHITCSHCRWDVTPAGFRCNGQFYYSWRPW